MATAPVDSSRTRPTGSFSFDLMGTLGSFLAGATPRSLLIHGAAGTGKSTLLRSLALRRKGPVVYLLYRSSSSSASGERIGRRPSVSVLLLDPTAPVGESATATGMEDLMALGPVSAQGGDVLPPAVHDAMRRGSEGGVVVIDSWDVDSERDFRSRAGAGATVTPLHAPPEFLRLMLDQSAIGRILTFAGDPEPDLLSAADGVVQLGWEDSGGYRLRVVSVPKLRSSPPPEPRYLYSMEGGRFYCPPQFAPEFRPPIGAPPPDPHPGEASLFPGSTAFEEAFGRLRMNGYSGLELFPRTLKSVADVFVFPLVSHVLSLGGHVTWIPDAPEGPQPIITQLRQWTSLESLWEGLRILSTKSEADRLVDWRSIILTIETELDPGRTVSARDAATPLIPQAYRFLEATPAGKPALYVIYFDGLRALLSAAGRPLTPETFPLVVASYGRLPGFHGFGVGRSDDPIETLLASQLDTHIRVEERYGRTVLFGVRPRSNPFILDWPEGQTQYGLLPVR